VSRLINTTTMTVDGMTDVGEWYVSEAGHDRAARDQFEGTAVNVARAQWNATAIEGDVAEEVSRLKNELDGDLFLIGCGELARHLIANGLVDDSGVTLLRYEPDLV
jgi:hypothetical protein